MKKSLSGLWLFAFCLMLFSSVSLSAEAEPNMNKPINFATEATYPPFVTLSPAKEMGGFETKLVKYICKEANLQCEFLHRPFDSLFPNLAFKKIDAVFGCIGITNERKSQVLFSNPMYITPIGFIAAKEEVLNFNQESLAGKTIALQQGATTFESYIKKQYPKSTIKTYASIQDALIDLKTNRIHAVFGDIPVFKYWIKNTKQENYGLLQLPNSESLTFSEGNGIAVRLEDKALIEKINQAIELLKSNGTIEKLEQQYLN